jgi:hypothetical protein
VLEPKIQLWRYNVCWRRLLFFCALIAVPAILSSCGSSSATTQAPTISASCTPTQVTVLGTSLCTAQVNGLSSTLANWSVSGTGNGSIGMTSGMYTAPGTVPTNNVVTITATAQVQSTLSTTTTVTILQPTAISAVTCTDPNSISGLAVSTVSSGNELDCTATASTGAAVPVNWSLDNANNANATLNNGSISSQGVYTAALVPPPGQSVTITATSKALATDTKTVTITVVFGVKVLSGPYVFSTSGRLANASNVFWARVGTFSAGGGTLVGTEDTNQGGSPNTVNNTANNTSPPSPRNFTGSYSIGTDGRGLMQFCEDTSSPCPMGSPATAYFRIAIFSQAPCPLQPAQCPPQPAQMIEFSSPSTTSATTAAGGEMLPQDQLVFPANGNLSGSYSFDFSGVSTSAAEESSIGEFKADGFGNISAGSASPPVPGEVDINAGGVLSQLPLATTSYSISSNGRGTVNLNGLNFSFYPVSANRVKFIEIDSPASPITTPDSILFGDAYKQQISSNCGWGLNALNGSTVLETTGASSGVVVQDVGSFTASNGAVSAVSMDQNSGGAYTQPTGTGSDNYTLDACGRGTLSIAGHSYVFYIISPSDAALQEVTSGTIAHGFLVPSQGGPFADATLTGSYAFRFGGTDAAGAAGKREDFLGQLTSAGSGMGLAGNLDLNDFGATQTGCLPLTMNCVAITNGTYLPLPAGSLRATMSLPLGTSPATMRNLVLYMVSPTLFFALDTDTTGTAVGAIYNQF